jgi:hypothetical protein
MTTETDLKVLVEEQFEKSINKRVQIIKDTINAALSYIALFIMLLYALSLFIPSYDRSNPYKVIVKESSTEARYYPSDNLEYCREYVEHISNYSKNEAIRDLYTVLPASRPIITNIATLRPEWIPIILPSLIFNKYSDDIFLWIWYTTKYKEYLPSPNNIHEYYFIYTYIYLYFKGFSGDMKFNPIYDRFCSDTRSEDFFCFMFNFEDELKQKNNTLELIDKIHRTLIERNLDFRIFQSLIEVLLFNENNNGVIHNFMQNIEYKTVDEVTHIESMFIQQSKEMATSVFKNYMIQSTSTVAEFISLYKSMRYSTDIEVLCGTTHFQFLWILNTVDKFPLDSDKLLVKCNQTVSAKHLHQIQLDLDYRFQQ